MNHVKIVIVGDGSIGKTCVMVRSVSPHLDTRSGRTVRNTSPRSLITKLIIYRSRAIRSLSVFGICLVTQGHCRAIGL